MPKEIAPNNIQIQSTGDCLSESLCTIVGYLAPEYILHPVRTQKALIDNTDKNVTNLFDLLCELTVEARPWAKEILKEIKGLPKTDKTHSIVVCGYYQPKDNNVWFYTIDPYCSDHVFVNWRDLSRVLYVSHNQVSINMFSLFANHSKFLTDYSVKERHLNRQTKRKITAKLPGRNTREKLKYLLHPKKSTSRRQN